jgi:hypothetical protein
VILGHFRAERLLFNNGTTILLAGGDTKFRSIDSISTKAVACRENEKGMTICHTNEFVQSPFSDGGLFSYSTVYK